MATTRRKRAPKPRPDGPVRVRFDGLPKGMSTWVYTEDPTDPRPERRHPVGERYRITGQPTVKAGDIIEVQDLNDPRSERARIVRGQLERGVCHLIADDG